MTDPIPELSVNGRLVPHELFAGLLAETAEGNGVGRMQEVATALVIRELLLQQAEASGLAEDTAGLDEAAVETLIDQLLERDVPAQEPSDTEIERYFHANESRFVTAPLVELRHILLACAPDDIAGRQQAAQQAGGLLGQLAQGADFAGLAMSHSACPSKEQGGALGQISAGQTVPEFEEQVFALSEGLCPNALETRFGYHIVQVDHRVDGQPLPFAQARAQVARYLRDVGRQQAIRHYLLRLYAKADVAGVELEIQDEDLLQ